MNEICEKDRSNHFAGLTSENLGREDQLLMDPDNVFWGILRNGQRTSVHRTKLSALYQKVKKRCDEEMKGIRFEARLSAIYIDPTDRCNAHCPYCYVPAKLRSQGRSMTQQELDFVLEKIAVYFNKPEKKPVVIFHASEPLLVKDILFRSIEKFKDHFHFGLQTNALLLEEKDAMFIKRHRISIGISLDAADMETNNRLRATEKKSGNYHKAVQAIEWFRGYKGLNVIATMTKWNITKLPQLVRFLHKKGVGCVLINPVRLTQRNSLQLKPDEKLIIGLNNIY